MVSNLPPLLPLADVSRISTRSKSQLYRDIRDGLFPAPVKTGVKSVAWRGADVQAWLDGLTTSFNEKGAAA